MVLGLSTIQTSAQILQIKRFTAINIREAWLLLDVHDSQFTAAEAVFEIYK